MATVPLAPWEVNEGAAAALAPGADPTTDGRAWCKCARARTSARLGTLDASQRPGVM